MNESQPSFIGNVFKLATGSAFAQGFGILLAPIVTRLFAPEAFGVAALFSSIIGIIGVLSCLRYELSIMLPKDDEDAANLFILSVSFVLAISAATALIILHAGDIIITILHASPLKKYLWLVPIAVMINGLFLALNYWESRSKHFGHLSAARVISSLVTQISKLAAGFAGYASGGVLILTGILGNALSTLFLVSKVWNNNHALFSEGVRYKRMISGLKRHKKFPIYSTWSALFNSASQQLPNLILVSYFSPSVVGFYALGMAVLGLPMSLIGGAIAQVFFQRASEAHNRIGDLSEIVEEVFKRLVLLCIFPTLLVSLIGKEIFIIAFGARWAEAGIYVQIFSIWMFFQFISTPISTVLGVLERQRAYLTFDIVLFSTRIASLFGGAITGNVLLTLTMFSLISVLCYGFLSYWILLSAGSSVMNVLYQFAKYVLYCIPMMGIMVIAKWVLSLNPILILLLGAMSTICYYIIVIKKDEVLKRHMMVFCSNLYQPLHALCHRK